MRKSILFVAMKGKGVSQLLGTLAVAKKLRKLAPELDIIFFTTSLAVEWIRNEQFLFYYFPDKGSMPTFITPSLWNNYIKKRLDEVIQIHNPIAMIYDGAYPYTAVLSQMSQMSQRSQMKSVWIKKEGMNKEQNEMDHITSQFDYTIVQVEAGIVASGHESERRVYSPAAIFLEPTEAYSKEVARKRWGIEADRTLVYIQLTKEGNCREEETRQVLDVLLGKPEYAVVLGGAMAQWSAGIKRTLLTVVQDYPHTKNYLGVDFVISGAEYETYHDLLYFGMPAILIPSRGMPEERERAVRAHRQEAALCLERPTDQMIGWGIDYLFTHKQSMGENAKCMMPSNGADRIAKYILQQL